MRNYITSVSLILACILVFAGCAAKKQWQGQYVTISYTSLEPTEDFLASGYTVVAYEVRKQDKNSHVLYRFDIMKKNEKVGALEVTDFSQEMSAGLSAEGYEYGLMAGDDQSVREMGYDRPFVTRLVHQVYEDMPSYEEVKHDVIEVLSEM